MALFDQQQQEQQNQLQPYGVSFGARAKARSVQHVPYVPVNMNIGQRLFRARQLPAHPVREQHDVMLQDRVNQDMLQHNIQQQDNLAYNRRPYQDPQRWMTFSWTYSKASSSQPYETWPSVQTVVPLVRSTLLEDFALAGPKGSFATSNAKK